MLLSRNRLAALGLGVVIATMGSLSAHAADVMSGFFGNTMVIEVPGMGEMKMMYNKDKTYEGSGLMGEIKGTWEVKEGQLCTTQVSPEPQPGQPNPNCRPAEARKAGDSWQMESPAGPLTVTLKKGKV